MVVHRLSLGKDNQVVFTSTTWVNDWPWVPRVGLFEHVNKVLHPTLLFQFRLAFYFKVPFVSSHYGRPSSFGSHNGEDTFVVIRITVDGGI